VNVVENDAELVKSVLSGNISDFRKLLEKYQYSAERWAFHHVKNLADAENIAQEAFVEAYFRLDVLLDPDRFGSWLHSIVNNTAVSWLRRRRSTVSFEEIDSIYSGEGLFEHYSRYDVPTPEDILEQQERERQLQSAVSALPYTYQRVIIMFYFDDCSYKDIAACLDTSISAVKSTLHRARQQLRKEMLKNG
jgi:RNA polymerase sigma-70 factor (ECF subfamily)